MKEEYDFTDAEQGRFYRPLEELDIPVYLEREVREFIMKNIKDKPADFSLNEIVNTLIRQNIQISRKLQPEQTS